MVGRFVPPIFSPNGDVGESEPGALMTFYQNGSSTTLQTVYSDLSLSTALSNPVVADGDGRFVQIFGNALYSVKLTDSAGNNIWGILDDIGVGTATGNAVQFKYLTGVSDSLSANVPSVVVGDLIEVKAYSSSASIFPATWECTSITASLPASATAGDVTGTALGDLYVLKTGSTYYKFVLFDEAYVEKFGAPDTGDCTTAIQASADHCFNAGARQNKQMRLLGREYSFNAQITLQCGIRGEGPYATALGSSFKWAGSVAECFSITLYSQGWQWQYFRIDMTGVTTTTTAMHFDKGINSAKFDGVEFQGRSETTAGSLFFKGQSTNFTVGQVVSQASSGAFGTIASQVDAGASGELVLTSISGTFTSNNAITDPLGGDGTATYFERKYFTHDGIHVIGGDGAGTKFDCSLNSFHQVYFTRCRRGLTFTDPDDLASGGENTFINCFGNCKEWVFETTGIANEWTGGDYSVEDAGSLWRFVGKSGGGNVITGASGQTVNANGDGLWNHIHIASNTDNLGQVVNITGGGYFVSAPTYSNNGASDIFVTDLGVTTKIKRYIVISTKDGQADIEARHFEPAIGIKFPATQSPSTDVNVLDDYEEGSMTLTLATGATTTPTATGHYIKIGVQVTVVFFGNFGAITQNGAAITISGLPFPSSSTATERPTGTAGNVTRAQIQSTSHTFCQINATSSSTLGFFYVNGAGSNNVLLSGASGTFTPSFNFTMIYLV